MRSPSPQPSHEPVNLAEIEASKQAALDAEKAAKKLEQQQRQNFQINNNPQELYMLYHDSSAPDFKVGMPLFSIAEVTRHFKNNYEYYRQQLQIELNLVPQFHAEFLARGIEIQQKEYSATYEPKPWIIERIVQLPTGYTQLYLRRDGQLLVQMNSDVMETFVTSYDIYVQENMKTTRELLIKKGAIDADRAALEQAAQEAKELAAARKVMANDTSLTPEVRRAKMHNEYYAAEVRNAAETIVSAANKAKAKASKSAKAPSKSKDELIDSARQQFGRTYKF